MALAIIANIITVIAREFHVGKNQMLTSLQNGLKVRCRKMNDKNLNEWLFADIDDLIDCDYSDESEVETE